MFSIGIIWNSVYHFKDEIINDLSKGLDIKDSFTLDLADNYVNFVNDIYQSENMLQEKIIKKIDYMLMNPCRKIEIVLFTFDKQKVNYHVMKKKYVYTELEDMKMKIRKKYSGLIVNYTFDIVFHATDNIDELNNCYDVVKKYLSKDEAIKLALVKK